MALRVVSPTREQSDAVRARFNTAQDGTSSEDVQDRKDAQREIATNIRAAALLLDVYVEDGREKSLALTHLEEALMWAGKAIFS